MGNYIIILNLQMSKALFIIGMLVVQTFASVPVVSECEAGSSTGTFIVDTSNTYTDPSDCQKGQHITLYMNGVMTDDVDLSLLELDVYWAGTFLYNETAKESDHVSIGMPYTLTFGVDIPDFAPSGAYSMTGYVHGTASSLGTDDQKLACVKVDFSL